MSDYLILAVLIILCIVGSGLITYSIYRKFLQNKKKSIRLALTIVTLTLSIAIVGIFLGAGTLLIFGR